MPLGLAPQRGQAGILGLSFCRGTSRECEGPGFRWWNEQGRTVSACLSIPFDEPSFFQEGKVSWGGRRPRPSLLLSDPASWQPDAGRTSPRLFICRCGIPFLLLWERREGRP